MLHPARRHRAEPIHTRPARETHQKGFGLIIGGVPQRDMGDLVAIGPVGDQAIACVPRGSLQVSLPFPAAPEFDVMGQFPARAHIRDKGDFVFGFGAQAVIDGDHMQIHGVFLGKFDKGGQQRDGIAPP